MGIRAAELLNSISPSESDLMYGSDTDADSPMANTPSRPSPSSRNLPKDPVESRLEARELHKYLLAKTYFDCREYDRCAAVFLPGMLPKGSITPKSPQAPKSRPSTKGKAKVTTPTKPKVSAENLSGMSQKALFLSLYAKYIAGEKRKDEDSEMILGPADGGVTVNKELNGIAAILEQWFAEGASRGRSGKGWLEYLYGVVLAKGKNEELAKKWLMRSVQLYPFNWGAWQELSSLIGTPEEVYSAFGGIKGIELTCRSS